MKLVKVTVQLSLNDVLSLKQKYTKKVINSLPFKVTVGTTSWYITEEVYKTMRELLNQNN